MKNLETPGKTGRVGRYGNVTWFDLEFDRFRTSKGIYFCISII